MSDNHQSKTALLHRGLTAEEDEALVQFVNRTRTTGTSVGSDEEFTAAATHCYQAAKSDTPFVLVCDSIQQMVMAHACLLLLAITQTEERKSLRDQIRSEISQDWRFALDRIAALPAERLPSLEATAFSTNTPKVPISTSISEKAQEIATQLYKQLSLKIKLRLRQFFGSPRGNNRQNFFERPAIVTANLGLFQHRTLIGNGISSSFLGSLSSTTRAGLNKLCEQLLPLASLFPSTQKPEPAEALFQSLSELLSMPVFENRDALAVIFAIKNLAVDLTPDLVEPMLAWFHLVENAFAVDSYEKLCIVCRNPKTTAFNNVQQLHNPDGPAIEFADGSKIFAWNGVILPEGAILAPESLTVEQIDAEQNVEVRRILIQQYGMERYLKDSGAEKIDEDECGILFKRTLANDEPIVVVRVLNPTPEPDGSHKFYFLRVPPHVTKARAAVAWTFDLTAEEYSPLAQS